MKIKEILDLEKENHHQIILLKEGIFWRAYNISAFLFTKYVEAFKISKKYVKNVAAEIIHLGFPDTIFEKIQEKAATHFEIIEQKEKKVVFGLKENIKVNLEV